jgi:hypothetical protein
MKPAEPAGGVPGDLRAAAWKAQRRRQARVGLELTPAERLRWLEDALETLRRWCGRARDAGRVGGSGPAEDRAAPRD